MAEIYRRSGRAGRGPARRETQPPAGGVCYGARQGPRGGVRFSRRERSRMKNLHYFTGSIWVTVVGLALAAGLGWHLHHSAAGIATTVFIAAMLGVLEVSLSFDNAVVNASVMEDMNAVWRHRFLTWGMAFAVFGMRFVFPLVVVSVVAGIGPFEAVRLAALEPDEYARILRSAHVALGAFGGAFLGMVCLKYFFDAEKDVHWLGVVETRLVRLGKFEAIELAVTMLGLYGFSRTFPPAEALQFMVAGVFGLVTFIAVDGIGAAMEAGTEERHLDAHRAGFASFLYLNVLDASFSFDGVIGAFALTNNLFVIAIGLGIGAMFVRSLTIMLVEKGTLASYRYLEHGAFYAIGALAFIMMLGTLMHIPEAITGLIGAGFIGLSLWSSMRYNREKIAEAEAAEETAVRQE
jgi:hypothetical protein